MLTYNLLILTHNSTLYHADVKSAIFYGVEGYFEILANHAPLIAMIKPSDVKITETDGQNRIIKVSGGFFEFNKNQATLLVT